MTLRRRSAMVLGLGCVEPSLRDSESESESTSLRSSCDQLPEAYHRRIWLRGGSGGASRPCVRQARLCALGQHSGLTSMRDFSSATAWPVSPANAIGAPLAYLKLSLNALFV